MSNQAAQRKTTKGNEGGGGTRKGGARGQKTEIAEGGGRKWKEIWKMRGRAAKGPRAAIITLHKKVN